VRRSRRETTTEAGRGDVLARDVVDSCARRRERERVDEARGVDDEDDDGGAREDVGGDRGDGVGRGDVRHARVRRA